MLPLKEIKKVEPHIRRKRIRASLSRSGVSMDYNECKQAIPMSKGIYCGIRKANVAMGLCSSCPYFDQEPLEYRLFRRK